MDQDFTPTVKQTIEEICKRFEQWREYRKRGTPIPATLWQSAVSLCADHSIYRVSSVLRLDYAVLKKRFESSCYSQSLESVSSDFVEVDFRTSLPEYVLEAEHACGRMKFHIKGAQGFHLVELMKVFWGKG